MNEVLRQEKKYAVNVLDGAALRGRLCPVMHGDAHNGPQGYSIRSLYFDTPDDRILTTRWTVWSCGGRSACGPTAPSRTSPCWR